MKYPTIHDGEWVTPIMRGYKAICCGCGLCHRMDFKVAGRDVKFRATRGRKMPVVSKRSA
jgi:hypothetical protein